MTRLLPVRKTGTIGRGDEGWTSPMAVVCDESLSLDGELF
jgi:hypothetical protein